jgi:hypothetical protein
MKAETPLPSIVEQIAKQFVASLPDADGDPIFQDAIVKAAIRDFAWALFERFPRSRMEIAEQLENLAVGINEEIQRTHSDA